MGKKLGVKVSLDAQEHDQIAAAAEQVGMDVASFLRQAALIQVGSIKRQRYTRHELTSIHKEASSRGHLWTEDELRGRDLPLYWSASWVRARLAEGKTRKQIAILCGSHERTVQQHIRVLHGIQVFHTLSPDQIAKIRQRYDQGETRQAIAADFNVSNVTIGKHLKGRRTQREKDAGIMRPTPAQVHPEDASTSPPVEPTAVDPRHWSDRLFDERVSRIKWPSSTAVIAETVFDGNHAVAKGWTSKMVKKGKLTRLTRGWFDLAPST